MALKTDYFDTRITLYSTWAHWDSSILSISSISSISSSFFFFVFRRWTGLAAHNHTQGVTMWCSVWLMWLGIGENMQTLLALEQFKWGKILWRSGIPTGLETIGVPLTYHNLYCCYAETEESFFYLFFLFVCFLFFFKMFSTNQSAGSHKNIGVVALPLNLWSSPLGSTGQQQYKMKVGLPGISPHIVLQKKTTIYSPK